MSEEEGIKDFMQKWFEQFMGRFDRLDKFMDMADLLYKHKNELYQTQM